MVYFTALPTCHRPLPTSSSSPASCRYCLTSAAKGNFACAWCPASGQCSSGLDRRRQDWEDGSCHLSDNVTALADCPEYSGTDLSTEDEFYAARFVVDPREAADMWHEIDPNDENVTQKDGMV